MKWTVVNSQNFVRCCTGTLYRKVYYSLISWLYRTAGFRGRFTAQVTISIRILELIGIPKLENGFPKKTYTLLPGAA